MTPQDVINAFQSVGMAIHNVGISGDELHVDTYASEKELRAAMDALEVDCSEIDDRQTSRRGYFYPPSLKGWG